MNARHILYGPALATRLPPEDARLPSPLLAFGLTDEVFATAMGRIPRIAPTHREYWYLGLQTTAYAAWVLGTVLGATMIDDLRLLPVSIREALSFMLPALFFALLLETGMRKWNVAIMAVGTFCRDFGIVVRNR